MEMVNIHLGATVLGRVGWEARRKSKLWAELVENFRAAVDIHAHEFEPYRKRGVTHAEQLIEERSDDVSWQLGQHAAHAPMPKPEWFYQPARERAAHKIDVSPPNPGMGADKRQCVHQDRRAGRFLFEDRERPRL
jgi:hypothetical protein